MATTIVQLHSLFPINKTCFVLHYIIDNRVKGLGVMLVTVNGYYRIITNLTIFL